MQNIGTIRTPGNLKGLPPNYRKQDRKEWTFSSRVSQSCPSETAHGIDSWTQTYFEDQNQFFLTKFPDIRKMDSYTSQLKTLAKKLTIMTNEKQLWAGSVIYCRDLLLTVKDNSGKFSCNAEFLRMSNLLSSLVSKIHSIESANSELLNKLFD